LERNSVMPAEVGTSFAVSTGWERLRPVTLVDRAAEAIIAGAAAGLILPGDRIVEAEVARSLGISRVPVREALRMLESQGLLTNEPYKGLRLMRVDAERLRHLLDVRVALETAAARAVLVRNNGRPELRDRLSVRLREMERDAVLGDAYVFANADTSFHRELCVLSGNAVLCKMWEQLARQLTIIVGLSTLLKSKEEIVDEHRRLMKVFTEGELDDVVRALEEHIHTQNEVIDFESLVARQRAAALPRKRVLPKAVKQPLPQTPE